MQLGMINVSLLDERIDGGVKAFSKRQVRII